MTSNDSAISFQVKVEKRADGARAEDFILCCLKAEARFVERFEWIYSAVCGSLPLSLLMGVNGAHHSLSLAFCHVTVAVQIYLYIYIAPSFWLDYAKGLSPGHVTWVSRSTLRKLDAAHCCRSPAVYGLHAEGEQTEERRRQKERWPRSLQLFLKVDSKKVCASTSLCTAHCVEASRRNVLS